MKNNKGITLIALTITIIVILILATLTINLVIGEDGIIKRAQDTKIAQEKVEMQNRMEIAVGTASIKGEGNLTWINIQWALDCDNEIKNSGLKIIEEREDYFLISNENNPDKEILYEYTVYKEDERVEDGLKLIKEKKGEKFTATLTTDSEGNLIATNCKFNGTDFLWQVDFPNYIVDSEGKEYKVISLGIHSNYQFSKVTLPNGLIDIEKQAFYNCKNLKEIVILEGVETIGENAFYNCKNLKEIVIPESVKKIERQAFRSCKNLKEIVISEGVETIGEKAFIYCSYLKEIVIPESVKTIGVDAFNGCENLKEIVISEGVETIGEKAFFGCKNLKEIVIPKSVKIIDNSAFFGGTDSIKKEITINYNSELSLGDDVFGGVNRITVNATADEIKTSLSKLSEYKEKVYDKDGNKVFEKK